MKTQQRILMILVVVLSLSFAHMSLAQQQSSVVPTLVNFSGTLTDANNKPVASTAGVTFYLYNAQEGGSPLWMETQNVQPDKNGHYTVTLGSTTSQGLPTTLFASGEARWLGVQPQGQPEQARVMLLAVPYALKAGDAQTLGGLPASAFLVAPSVSGTAAANAAGVVAVAGVNSISGPGQAKPNLGGSGTQDYLPIWTDSSGDLGNSVLYQVGSGATAKIGLNLKSPLASLDVNGTELVRGVLETATLGNASATKGFNSNPFVFEASSFNSGTAKAATQNFQWQAEPAGNNSTNPGATLNLLFFQNTNKPVETGLLITNSGAIQTTNPGQSITATLTANTGLTGAISGNASATGNGSAIGVQGNSAANTGYGVYGTGTYTGVYGQAGTYGILGNSSGGIGTYGGSVFSDGIQGGSTYGNGVHGIGSTNGVLGTSSAGTGVNGVSTASSGIGVYGTAGSNGYGVFGNGGAIGVFGSNSTAGWGVYGSATSSGVAGVGGVWQGPSGLGLGVAGVWGDSNGYAPGVMGTSDSYPGVYGESSQADGVDGVTDDCSGCAGVLGLANGPGYGAYGVYGENDNASGGQGIWGIAYGNGFYNGAGSDGVHGVASNSSGSGVAGVNVGSGGTGVYGSTPDSSGYAGYFDGNIYANNLFHDASQMKIDHPADPTNKYLYHASVESSEMMTMYSGNVTLNRSGEAQVELPSWFEALNRDFRYQLTPVGAPGPNLYIAKEISGGHFTIAGGKAGSKVSWTVTAVRQDAYAKAHPMVIEMDKASSEHGTYLHPELYGAAKESGLSWARYRYPQPAPKPRSVQRANRRAPRSVAATIDPGNKH